jgi:predicted nucleic acid-binding protein
MSKQIVIDTSCIIAVLFEETNFEKVLKATSGTELFAPASLPWEIGNAFSAMLKQRRISRDEGIAALELYERIPVELIDVPLARALTMAAVQKIYAYDAYMIVCAEIVLAPMMTLDSRLKSVARSVGIPVLELS